MSLRLDHLRPARLSILTALTVGGALVTAPAAQSAATSVSVSAATGVITLDAADDTVRVVNGAGNLSHGLKTSGGCLPCFSDFDWNSSTPLVEEPLAASPATQVELNGGDGADALTAPQSPGDILKATLNGGGGNDLLTGSSAADDLRGGTGDDRLAGFLGADDVEGGDGNDALVWNDGDGTDVLDGDLGNDGVEVNAAPTTGDAIAIAPAGARVALARSTPVPFSLDILAERLEVNGLGGADTIAAGGALSSLALLTLDGGTGNDTLTGADGPDLLLGDEKDDTLNGGAGDDRIVGDRGNDTMNGGPGDDTLAWSNGDNDDVIDGDDGRDVVEVNGSPTAGDAFAIGPGATAGRIRLDRSNLVAFTLDIGTSEAMALRSLGGDDTIGVGEVGAFQIAGDGGAGNDSLNGAGGSETFLGGSGNDAITPGLGIDSVAGDEGDDTIAVRDGLVDFTRCGAGTDQVTADAIALDAGMEGCETVDRPPTVAPGLPPPTTSTPGPVPTASTVRPVAIASATVKIKKSKGKIVFACPSTNLCRVRLNLLAGATASGINVVVVLARASFDLRPGEAKSVRIEVPKRAGELANRKGRLSVLAVATTTGASSATATRTQRLTLDFGKPKKKVGR